MRVALVSAVYGGYDAPKPLPPDHGFDDAVLVTDVVDCEADGWRVVVAPSSLHPRLAAKRPKMLPWEFVDADASVWIDGAYHVNAGGGLRAAADRNLARHDLVVSEHWEDRDDAYAEAEFCRAWPKYRDWPLAEQTAHYSWAGLPRGSGLWACGTVARQHTPQQMALGAAWLAECHAWTIQDQVSFPYVCWRAGVTPGTWDEPIGGLLVWSAHARDD